MKQIIVAVVALLLLAAPLHAQSGARPIQPGDVGIITPLTSGHVLTGGASNTIVDSGQALSGLTSGPHNPNSVACNPTGSPAPLQDCSTFTILGASPGVALNGSELFLMYQGAPSSYNSISSSVMKAYFASTGCTTNGGALYNTGGVTQCNSVFTFTPTTFASPDGNTWGSTGFSNNGLGIQFVNTGSATTVPLIYTFAPNLTAGQNSVIQFGRDQSNNDAFSLQFTYAGSGSNSNSVCFSVYGGGCILTATGGGITTAAGALLSSAASGGVGYKTGAGAGGTVTQITSRTTGVTLNKITGAITLFSAAGSATAATFTVTNSSVAATDSVIVNQKSGTNLYETFVTAVAAGSFNITFLTTGGTATDAPVFNFSVIKGSAN